MLSSLVLNLCFGFLMKSKLKQEEYVFSADVEYGTSSSLQLYFDSGDNFNLKERVSVNVTQGRQTAKIPFSIKNRKQLKRLRLDFGNSNSLKFAAFNAISLSSKKGELFHLKGAEIANNVWFSKAVESTEKDTSRFILKDETPFDAYIVLNPMNELMVPLWQRVALLLVPWVILLFFPIFQWVKERFQHREFEVLISSLFIAAIPMKSAWVTFVGILLLGYAIFVFIRHRRIQLKAVNIGVFVLFIVPLLFLGNGKLAKLSIPLSFVIFPAVCSVVDFTKHQIALKKVFTRVFLVIMSITITYWTLLVVYEGYFYGISFHNYFLDLKTNAHRTLYWLYYDHTTFLSFFILIGNVFCYELYIKRRVSLYYFILYTAFLCFVLSLLGSRFTITLALILPFLYVLSDKNLSKVLIPLWGIFFTGAYFFIDRLDATRATLWEISSSIIDKSPWLGHGTGMSEHILPKTIPITKAGRQALMPINHAHNQFLTYLLENGVLGLLLAVSTMLFIFWRFSKQKNKSMLLITFLVLMMMIIETPFKTATISYLVSFLLTVFSEPQRNYTLSIK